VLVGLALVILWGTFFPLISEAITGTEQTVGPPWFNRLTTGSPTHHATAADGHRNLLITMAMDKSARTGRPVALPPDPATLLAD
jgi:hypothetical protein